MGGERGDSGGFDDTLPSSGASSAPAPERVGRDRLERVLGRGGMGVVHAARDPDLDRLVALKVMHESRGQARLVREAQAMARLRHPNVLTVHDVGVADDRVYITMELIEGTTLRAWQTAAPRTWRDIVARYIAAGRGLAAAHAADIVHRDFNPGNVLVGNDGAVRVADFGLARTGEPGADDPAPVSSGTARTGDPLTTVGTVVGTPAYMAPEQHDGGTVGPAADQFAFAAAMWEALAGTRPFVGDTIEALAAAKREERLGPAPRRAPAWLVALLRRAMRRDPGDRHASMTELVDALEHGLGRRRRRLVVGAAVAAAAGVAAIALVVATRAPAGPGCKVAGADVAATWNDAARARITAAFTASDRPHAAATLARVLVGLDGAAGALASARIAACEASRTRGSTSADVLARRDACLDRSAADLRATVELLGAGPDADVIDNAYRSVERLDDPAECEAAAQSAVPLPAPAIRAQVDAARAHFAETEALFYAGKYDDAGATIDAQIANARELGFAPLLAQTLILRARILEGKGKTADSIAAYTEGAEAAAAARDDRMVALALVDQLSVIAYEGAKPAEALQWIVAAEAAVARVDDPYLRESFLIARGTIYRHLGRFEEAVTDLRAALASSEARDEGADFVKAASNLANALWDLGKTDEALALDRRAEDVSATRNPEHLAHAQLLGNTGIRLATAGKFDEARDRLERALSIKERYLGPAHPSVATSLNNLAGVAVHQRRDDEALTYYRRALAIREKELGPEHPQLASTLTNIGQVLERRGTYDEALAVLHRALAIREKALGPEHPSTASTVAGMASVLSELGRHDEALAAAKRALAIREKALGEHKLTASSHDILANVLADMGRTNEACAAHARALAMLEKVEAPDHPSLVLFLVAHAHCRLDQGKAREALPLAERAVTIGEKSDDGDDTHLARAQRVLAYALWETGGDRDRALQLARDAHARLVGVTSQKAANAELVRWLKARGVSVAAP